MTNMFLNIFRTCLLALLVGGSVLGVEGAARPLGAQQTAPNPTEEMNEPSGEQNLEQSISAGTFTAEVRGALQFNFQGRAWRLENQANGVGPLLGGLVLQLQGGGGYAHCQLTILYPRQDDLPEPGTYPIMALTDSLPAGEGPQTFQAVFGCHTPSENYYYQAQEGAIEIRQLQRQGSVVGQVGMIARRRGIRIGEPETLRIRSRFFAQPRPETAADNDRPAQPDRSGLQPDTTTEVTSDSTTSP